MLIAALIVFVVLRPREGRVNAMLKNDFTETTLMMSLIALVFAGAILLLSGAPTGMPTTTVR